MRLSIEVSQEEHQQLKAIAALSGKSIKAYVLERVLPATQQKDEQEALSQLETLLKPRLLSAQNIAGDKSVTQIFEETHQDIR